MITTSSAAGRPSAPITTVTVLLSGRATDLAGGLQSALAAQSWARSVDWLVVSEPADTCATADIAVCTGSSIVRALRRRRPAAAVIALVDARDDGTDTVASLLAGADVCVRGEDAGLLAAYLQSVARRRGLLDDGGSR